MAKLNQREFDRFKRRTRTLAKKEAKKWERYIANHTMKGATNEQGYKES